jgi:hypothetical protein
MSAPPVKSGTWALEIGRRPPIGIDRKKGGSLGKKGDQDESSNRVFGFVTFFRVRRVRRRDYHDEVHRDKAGRQGALHRRAAHGLIAESPLRRKIAGWFLRAVKLSSHGCDIGSLVRHERANALVLV